MPNRLEKETSPYLRQHANNPVDWYPWGEEALKRAQQEEKPIFLSIGYSACHWCHVMERESFENVQTAELLNADFISIKVDREERPDLDQVYMSAVQMMTQHGGWPMSVFLTPDQKPFYGGTYFPPEDRMGMPSFASVIRGVAKAWRERRNEIVQTAEELSKAVGQLSVTEHLSGASLEVSDPVFQKSMEALKGVFDSTHGGFGAAPKFFHSTDLRLCLQQHWYHNDADALEMVTFTLDKWACGGIYDQVGGGFHRYSTDAHWFAPHFEKMLYDNALLVPLYLEAYQVTQNKRYLNVVDEVLSYVKSEMQDAAGGYYSTQDADSEGEEGKFYVWSKSEIEKALGDQAESFIDRYNLTDSGNWESGNILHLTDPLSPDERNQFLPSLKTLAEIRSKRIAPFRDEKILTAWNGLMIEAMADAYRVSGNQDWLTSATRAADFLLSEMIKEGQLYHVHKDGITRHKAYLDDYAAAINGLIGLYQADLQMKWLEAAMELALEMDRQFRDGDAFYYTSPDHEALIARTKEIYDGALPSATGMALTALARLGLMTGQTRLLESAEKGLQAVGGLMTQAPRASGQLLMTYSLLRRSPKQRVFVVPEGEATEAIHERISRRYAPDTIDFVIREETLKTLDVARYPILEGKALVDGNATAYLCENFTCQSPKVGWTAIGGNPNE